ncbi:MAG: hypothetical protein KBT33_03300 [Prevotellaceae bacterium]|nr:hypothetical protein [Candidatus Minthosoma equi]
MLQFQKTIATSQMTLPIVGVLAAVVWILLPQPANMSVGLPDFCDAEYGLWQLIPHFLTEGLFSLGIALSCAAFTVYLMAELNNTHVLLRISSRLLSSMLAMLMTFCMILHTFQPGSIAAIFILLSFFPLFHSYQLPHPTLSFTTFLLISLASLVFTKILLLVPIYWFIQAYIRALSFRCFVASILAILLPYWIYGGIALFTDSLPFFLEHVTSLIQFSLYDYTQLTINNILPFAFLTILFAVGTIDFYRNNFLDKTRTRILYNVVIMHGAAILLFICLQPQYFTTMLPLFIIDVSIVYGHFAALTYNRFSHILCIVLTIAALAIMASEYFII